MSVIVRGVDMPKNCALCKFRGAGETWYPLTLQDVPGNTISEDCPLGPVPEHGRLIEAEPIMKYIADGLNSGEFGYDQIKVLSEIQYAPTIIPADDAWPEWRTQVLGIRRQEEE